MKKKGLIVLTVALAVVLVVALVTVTFAWFSNNANASIEGVQLSASAASSLQIAVVTPSARGLTSGKPQSLEGGSVASGDVKKEGTGWTGDVTHLGSTINFADASFLLNSAVSINKEVEAVGGANQWEFFKGNSSGNSSDLDKAHAQKAVANTDYFQANFIVQAAQSSNVKQAFLKVSVKPTDNTQLGMAGAITFAFKINDKLVKIDGTDAGSTHMGEEGTTINAFYGQEYGNAVGDGQSISKGEYDQSSKTWSFYLQISKYNDTPLTADIDGAISVEVFAWIEGTSPFCNNTTAGSGGAISMEFIANTETAKTVTDGKTPK